MVIATGSTHDKSLSSPDSLSEQVTAAALNYRANALLIDNMLKEIGLVDKETGILEELITDKREGLFI